MTDPSHARHLPLFVEDPVAFAENALTRDGFRVVMSDPEPPSGLEEYGAEQTGAHPIVPPAPVSAVVVTRDMSRSRRKREVRARTISMKRMTKRELDLGRMLYPDVDGVGRPKTRADCINHEGPCPFVSCEHHLYLDVSAKTGAIKLNFPDLEVWELPAHASCSLDVADAGGQTLERVGEIMNLTRERIRQIEVSAMAKVR